MSDSTSINPVGVATAVVGGAAVGSLVPRANALVHKYVDCSRADSFVSSAKKTAKDLKVMIGNVLSSAIKTINENVSKILKNNKPVEQYLPGLEPKTSVKKGLEFLRTSSLAVANFIKKPMVAGALIAGLAYAVVTKLGDKG